MNCPALHAATAPLVLLADFDRELATLVAAWLGAAGLRAAMVRSLDTVVPALRGACALAIVDLPFPREGGSERLRAWSQALPGCPLVALSPAFDPHVKPRGALAASLGVDAVLPAPVTRQVLVDTVFAALAARA